MFACFSISKGFLLGCLKKRASIALIPPNCTVDRHTCKTAMICTRAGKRQGFTNGLAFIQKHEIVLLIHLTKFRKFLHLRFDNSCAAAILNTQIHVHIGTDKQDWLPAVFPLFHLLGAALSLLPEHSAHTSNCDSHSMLLNRIWVVGANL